MHAMVRWWHRRRLGAVRHAWGMAPHEGTWVLAGLIRQSATLVQVHTLSTWAPPAESDRGELTGLSQHLRQHRRMRGGAHQRLNMAMPSAFVLEGFMDFPLDRPEEDWLDEVHLEVAHAFQLAPDEVNFDFEATQVTDGLVRRVRWVGCAQAHMTAFKNCTRAAGWRLAAVEIEHQAAYRAVRALRGGADSLLTQAPQDWQFHLSLLSETLADERPDAVEASEEAIEQAVAQMMHTPGGSRLVAAGLALKAWQ